MTARTHRRFPPELRTASVVPRWSIVWTLTKDNVAVHSFFVTFYAREIARIIKWQGDIGDLMFRALSHDLDELQTGDIVSPVKAEIIDESRAEIYIDTKMRERLPFVMADLDEISEETDEQEDGEAWAIVKAADRLDALIFLLFEVRLGNNIISPNIPRAWNRFEAAWKNLPGDKDDLDRLWNTVIVPAVKAHEQSGGFGI